MCEIDVILNDAESRKTAELKTEEGKLEKHYMFYDGESVSGKVSDPCESFLQVSGFERQLTHVVFCHPKVNINVKQTSKRLEHLGIRIEFVGQIGKLTQCIQLFSFSRRS